MTICLCSLGQYITPSRWCGSEFCRWLLEQVCVVGREFEQLGILLGGMFVSAMGCLGFWDVARGGGGFCWKICRVEGECVDFSLI